MRQHKRRSRSARYVCSWPRPPSGWASTRRTSDGCAHSTAITPTLQLVMQRSDAYQRAFPRHVRTVALGFRVARFDPLAEAVRHSRKRQPDTTLCADHQLGPAGLAADVLPNGRPRRPRHAARALPARVVTCQRRHKALPAATGRCTVRAPQVQAVALLCAHRLPAITNARRTHRSPTTCAGAAPRQRMPRTLTAS